MKKRQHGLMYFVIIFFGLVAFSACIASEFKRSKAKDMKLDGMSCHLPISPAFVLGAFASTSLLSAQIIGNTLIFCSRGKNIIAWKQRIPFSLMILSWITFGCTIMLLAVATSMNQIQPYGEGWLDGECYVVKDGVYFGSAALTLANLLCILGSILACKQQIEQEQKGYAVTVR